MQDFKDLYPQRNIDRRLPRGRKRSFLTFSLVGLVLAAAFVFNILFDPSTTNPYDRSGGSDEGRDNQDTALDIGETAGDSTSFIRWLAGPFTTLDEVKVGDTFETLLRRNGVNYDRMMAMLECARPLYNLNRVVVGRDIKFIFRNEELCALEYEIDHDRTLQITRADSSDWNATVVETEYEVREREIAGTIVSSLYESVLDAGATPELALRMSEIFAWQIDFQSDVQRGDRFRIVFEEKVHPKGSSRVGEIFAVVYETASRDFYAIKYTNKDGTVDYFDLDGLSMRRQFLKSPFKYMPRISSRFSHSRMHPILKIRRPHLGVDYAAPAGTPVLALGDGKVTFAGRKGGFGNYIQIKHNSMYATGYGHLSRFAVKNGANVRQGEVIGYVGSTGLATGPHLDFRFFRNGTPVDPLKVDIPTGVPVDKSLMIAFQTHRDTLAERLKRIGSPYGPNPPRIAYTPATSVEGPGLESTLNE